MRTRSTHSSDDINLKKEEMEVQERDLVAKKHSDQNGPENDEVDDRNEAVDSTESKPPTEEQGNEQETSDTDHELTDNDVKHTETSEISQPFVLPQSHSQGSNGTKGEKVTEKTESKTGQHESEEKRDESKSLQSENKAKNDAIMSIFRPDPTSFFSGPMEKEFAKSFYNSLNMLASQALTKTRNEPNTGDTKASANLPFKQSGNGMLQVPPRNDSRSSIGSKSSYDARRSGSSDDNGSTSPSGSDILSRPLPGGISPKSLAEQLRNSDSASMVVSRQLKFGNKNPGYSITYANSDGTSTPPGSYVSAHLRPSSPRSSDYPTLPSQITPSTSLHHFTTRYTIEKPVDPSRLGVELVLDHVNEEPVIEVECGGNRGLLYVNKLCQGSKGQSIHFNEEWLTPNEFQFISGRETAKDWKRSIRHCGKSLKTLMTKGILQVHPPICECSQCRDLHGSKLLPGKKLTLKNLGSHTGRNIEIPSPYNDASHSNLDNMTRHGYEGSLNSIISQLHKASGFDASTSPDTLDLTSKSHGRHDVTSPTSHSRKRSREESEIRTLVEMEERHRRSTSPSPKRPYSGANAYVGNGMSSNTSFAASYALMSPEEQYRNMLALMSRSLSPEEQQRHFLNLAQTVGSSLGLHSTNMQDYAGSTRSSNPADYLEKVRGKSRQGSDRPDGGFHPYDLSAKMARQREINTQRRGHTSSSSDKYRRFERNTNTPSRSDQKYITLESRQRDDRSGRTTRDDVRSWTASRHAAMIELSSRQNQHSEKAAKSSWQTEHYPSSRYRNEGNSTLNRNRQHNGGMQDKIALDHAPISKTPVTTLHHRPHGNESQHETPRKHHHSQSNQNRTGQESSKYMPMVDLQKHAVPMLSLRRPTKDNLFPSNADRKQSPSEDGDSISQNQRQSSSAPPPFISSDEKQREPTRPTSAQDRISTSSMEQFQSRSSINNGFTSNRNASSLEAQSSAASCNSFLRMRSKEIQNALDRMKIWKTDDVCEFLQAIDPSITDHIEDFRNHDIDGEGLPLLTDRHLMDIMNIKLGCALKIVARVKRELTILPESISCLHHYFIPSVPTAKSVETGATRERRESTQALVKSES